MITAYDPDGGAPSLTAAGLPSFANFIDHGDGTATLELNPQPAMSGRTGGRQFDVFVENNLVRDDYDIYADVGGQTAVVKSFIVTSDTNLDIDLGHETDKPAIKAIEIRQAGTQLLQIGIGSDASSTPGAVEGPATSVQPEDPDLVLGEGASLQVDASTGKLTSNLGQ